MDIDQHVNQIVQNIISDITTKVQLQVASIIDQKVSEIVAALDTKSILSDQLGKKIDAQLSQLPINTKSIETQLLSKLDNLSLNLASQVQTKSLEIATTSINTQVNKIDFREICQAALSIAIQNQTFTFPNSSIPSSALDSTGLQLSGDHIVGGIIKNFGSTGIDDKSTACQLTILDDVTVVENNLLTRDLTVKGTTTIEGDLIVSGTVPESSPMFKNIVESAANNLRAGFNQELFHSFSNSVFTQIKAQGLDLNKITLNGIEVLSGGNLAPTITFSSLQRVGQLSELQVRGESLFADTMYVNNKRVGINTLEPTQALSVWDQEVEIGFGKHANNVGVIGTSRNHSLILSSNAKNNLVLTPDGAVTVTKLNIGNVTLTSASSPPSNDQPQGTIVFNSNPTLGGPLGWVSLGNASWANFGIID